MPPKAKKDSLIILLNVGMTDTLVEKAKCIARRKIEQMIFFQPKHEVALILMGSPKTKNTLDSEHIQELKEFMVPNWDFVELIIGLKSTKYKSNWVEAIEAAVEFMKEHAIDAVTKKIMLLSDFNEDTDIISQFDADLIADRLSSETVELTTISDRSLDDSLTSLNPSEELLKNVHQKLNSVRHTTFDNAVSNLRFYTPVSTKPHPTNFTLELVDLKIPISIYVKISEEKYPSWNSAKDGQKIKTERDYVDRQRNLYTKDEVIKGYDYGGEFVPVQDELEKSMSYESGDKSYKIHSFTDKNNIDLEYLYSTPAHIILPKDNGESMKQFYSLVQAMQNTNTVAIVRKVFRLNSIPRMVALFPCTDVPEEPWCLIELDLAFAEDRRVLETRSMKSIINQMSDEQNKALDDVIDSLTLPDIDDSREVDGSKHFLPGCVPNPATQHKWNVFSHRAINPREPVPAMDDYLKEIFQAPSIKERSKIYLRSTRLLFDLESIEPKKKEKYDEKRINESNTEVDKIKESDKIEEKIDDDDKPYNEDLGLAMSDEEFDLDDMVANI